MDNTAFRRLLESSSQETKPSASSARSNTSLLGDRNRSGGSKSRPVKPAFNQKPRQLKHSAPKGTKLADGYQDRAALSRSKNENGEDEEDPDGRAARIKALEEQVKLGQIDRATFEKIRDTITGGDVGATHLVKGLDRRLLARVRKGEDVMNGDAQGGEQTNGAVREPTPDLDNELDQLEAEVVAPVQREVVEKKGVVASPAPVAGKKRTRADILAELRASRAAAEEEAAKALARSQPRNGFHKMGQKPLQQSRIEIDSKGREVLITVDENGRTKRKVRKIATQNSAPTPSTSLSGGQANSTPLGMEVPEWARDQTKATDADENVDDLFADVGSSYNPLAALQQSNSDEDSASEQEDVPERHARSASPSSLSASDAEINDASDQSSRSPSPERAKGQDKQASASSARKPNYFNDTASVDTAETKTTADALKDPTLLAALRLAARRDKQAAEEKAAKDAIPSAAAQRLFQRDRDMDDIDMGFGGSRGADEEDDEMGDSRIKLREWKGLEAADDDDEHGDKGGRGGTKQRKRGKKKKGGDKNSAADVLKVMQGNRGK